jgi:ribulose-5-phosphate 4-epimerase/fuculose-1-phosphate aldolase
MSESMKSKLVTANRILANEGIIQGFGHVSVREPGSDEMLISRSRSPAFVEEDDIIRMDLEGNVLDDRDVRPYGETVIHRAIYRYREDVNAVVHHHAPAVMPFTVVDTEIRPVFHMAALFADGVPEFSDYDLEYGRLVVTEDEGERMAENLGSHRAQLLEGHGANMTGKSLEEVIVSTVFFVMNAQYQRQAMQMGEPRYYEGPEESISNILEDIILAPLSQERMWEYLERNLPGDQ